MPRTSTGSSSRRSAAPVPAFPVPAAPAEIRAALARLGVHPSRTLGQSFLADPYVADAEAALAGAGPGEAVLEIGGGLGIVTAALLRRGAGPITVVERDPRLAAFLRSTFGPRVTVVVGDARSVPLPPVAAAVGNLPFSVGTPVLRRLLEARIPRIVFLLQREVAERIAAPPGSRRYGRLSILARLYGEVELFRVVPAEAFFPRPAVAGRLGLHRARPGALPVTSVAGLERTVRVLFGARRKKLGNLLPRLVRSPEEGARAVAAAGWPADWRDRRPEELAPERFFALAEALRDRDGPG